jgi:homogentisate 1,2-dioxygenase
MFESRYVYHPTEAAMKADFRQRNYVQVWQGLRSHFDPQQRY